MTAEANDIGGFASLAERTAHVLARRTRHVDRAIREAETEFLEVRLDAIVAADLLAGWTVEQRIALSDQPLFQTEADEIVRIIDQTSLLLMIEGRAGEKAEPIEADTLIFIKIKYEYGFQTGRACASSRRTKSHWSAARPVLEAKP